MHCAFPKIIRNVYTKAKKAGRRGIDTNQEKLKVDALNPVYRELADLVGYENMEKLYRYYKGQQLSFPSRIYAKQYITEVLAAEYNGTNVKSLARKLGYSERWIRKLIREIEKEEE